MLAKDLLYVVNKRLCGGGLRKVSGVLWGLADMGPLVENLICKAKGVSNGPGGEGLTFTCKRWVFTAPELCQSRSNVWDGVVQVMFCICVYAHDVC